MKNKLLLILTLTGCFLCANIFADATGNAVISNVTPVNGECVQSTPTGNGQKWDVQAGGTYDVTLSNVTDCASQGNDSTIGIIVQNSVGGNLCPLTANQTAIGVYTFRVTLSGQCETMPILYCTTNCSTNTGLKAQDAPGGHLGHLRIATFDDSCAVLANPLCSSSPTPPPTASITACKFYDKNANGTKDAGENYLAGWPFGICPRDGAPEGQTQVTPAGGCVTWTNLTVPGDYTVTEADALESNWFHSPDPLPPPLIVNGSSVIMFPPSGGNETRTFGNYCTSPSGGLTLGFWSNKNGNKLLTGNLNGTGTTLLPAVVTLLNSCALVNANGSLHTFTTSYSAFRSWLLGANATNMAYMLSAQLATLKLDLLAPAGFGSVDGNAFDLCSHMTINGLISAACDQLAAPGGNYTIQGDPTRLGEEMLKNCIDAINNNGDVVPTTPCPKSFASPTPCP
jgi:hypothetical protein